MSISELKKDVFTVIGSFTSFNKSENTNDPTNTMGSVNNQDKPLKFMLDILKVVSGSTSTRDLVGNILIDICDDVNPVLSESLLRQSTQHNSDDALPSYFDGGLGVVVPLNVIDMRGLFKINPFSQVGLLLYGNNNNSFNHVLYNSINDDSVEHVYSNLAVRFDNNNNTFIFKKNFSSTAITINDFFDELLGYNTVIDKEVLVSGVLDDIFGTIQTNSNKTLDEIIQQKTVERRLSNFIEGDNDFNLSDSDVIEIERLSKNLVDGVNNNEFSCGTLPTSVDIDTITTTVNNIMGSDDGDSVSTALENVLNVSFDDNDVLEENKETIRDEYNNKIIESIKRNLLLLSVLSPFSRTVAVLSNKFSDDNNNNNIEDNKNYIQCISDDISQRIHKYVYDIVIALITSLVKPITRKIINEKVNNYTNILRSLVLGR